MPTESISINTSWPTTPHSLSLQGGLYAIVPDEVLNQDVGTPTISSQDFQYKTLDNPDALTFALYNNSSDISLQYLLEENIAPDESKKILEIIDGNLGLKLNFSNIIETIRTEFPSEPLRLEIMRDPESTEEDITLFLYILSKDKPSDLFPKLDRIDHAVFEVLRIDSILFSIDIRYI